MKRFRNKSRYEDEATIVHTTINKIECRNIEIGQRLKTVFYCPSYLAPEGRMCVYWGRTNIDEGDEIEMKGRFSDGVFLAWSLSIHKKAKRIENDSGNIQNRT